MAAVPQQTPEPPDSTTKSCLDGPCGQKLDQRRYPRIAVRRVISIRLSSGTTVNAMMTNLSLGGAGFLYEVPAEVGATLRFSFVMNTSGRQQVVELSGVVRHSHLTPQGFYTGVEWREVKDELCCMMQAFLSDRVRLKQEFGW